MAILEWKIFLHILASFHTSGCFNLFIISFKLICSLVSSLNINNSNDQLLYVRLQSIVQ